MKQDEYIEQFLGKRIDIDSYPRYGKYQCVDLYKHYMLLVYGINIKTSGNANQIYHNRYKNFNSHWKRYNMKTPVKKGDIIVSLNGAYGHVAVVREDRGNKVLVLEQNGKGGGNGLGENAIRLKEYPKRFRAGFRRIDFNN